MHLVQLLLPLYDNEGRGFGETPFAAVREELTRRFGGVTAYMRSPATGLWKKSPGPCGRTYRPPLGTRCLFTAQRRLRRL